MKPRSLDLLVCPIDKTRLELIEWETAYSPLSPAEIKRIEHLGLTPNLFEKEIVSGVLLNRARKIYYPVHRGIPRLLIFTTGVTGTFVKEHEARIKRELHGYTTPNEPAMPGEETVLRTFSSEWVNYDWDEQHYWNLSADDMYKCMNFMLDIERKPVQGQLVLEVGIGIGGIADYMARKEECELVGVDLSYAVDAAYRHFGKNPFLHIVQASAFAPPFNNGTFDLVYSQGVLHHTFSTKCAFQRICKLPKPKGRLYIWVYSPSNEKRSLPRRLIMAMENVVRPLCWRLPERLQAVALLPIIPLYLIHQNLLIRWKEPTRVTYGWREAVHAARDRFTPRYIHRHTEAEISGWFKDAGYSQIQVSSAREVPKFVPMAFVHNTAVDGIRVLSER
jgi:SAM-dependent methyltransferase/uncharacterized protein YbaR (Trm112 family)